MKTKKEQRRNYESKIPLMRLDSPTVHSGPSALKVREKKERTLAMGNQSTSLSCFSEVLTGE